MRNRTPTDPKRPDPERLLTVDDILPRFRFSRTHLYDLIRKGEFPAPMKFGQLARWQQSTIDEYLRSKRTTANNAGA